MDREDKLHQELRHHLEQLTAEYIRAGMSKSEARRQARLEFGSLELIKDDCRDVRPRQRLEEIFRDIHFAVRGFRRNPRFAVSAVAVIALAIGGASAVFSVVDRNLLRPLPYRSGDRLISIGIVAPVITAGDWLFAGTYREWRSALQLGSITAWKGITDCDRSDGAPERLSCAQVEANFLPTLGVRAMMGRNFTAEEDRPDADPTALLSYDLWRARFGGDPAILEKRITLDGVVTRIAGVLPPEFELPSLAKADVLLPLKLPSAGQNQRLLSVVGRLPPNQSAASAEAQVQPLFQALMQTLPANLVQAIQPRLRVATLRDQQTREYQSALWMLLGAVLSFVLLACANVASLLLARSAARQQEFAVRAALGASRSRLVQQTLIESAVVAAAAIPLGWALASLLLAIFRRIAPAGVMRIHQAELDWRVFLFALAISCVAALLFGLAPAMERLRGEDLTGSRISGPRRQWLRSALVCAQLSVSVVLLTSSGLFLTSLWRLQQAPLGFSPATVVTASFVLPAQRYGTEERQIAFFAELERRLAESPGVAAAAITDSLPPAGDPRSFPLINFWRGAAKENAQDNSGPVKWRFVTAGYLHALGIPIVRGRAFSADDSRGVPKVIVNETLARKVFEEQNPVGREIPLWGNSCQVVGVAANARNSGLAAAPDPELYVLRPQTPNAISANQRPPFGWRQAIAVVRSSLGGAAAAETLRLAMEHTDPSIAIVIGSLDLQVNGFLARPRFQTAVLLFFAFLGLFLAAFGLYGLTSFLAAERTREVGIRIALGATPRRIVGMMMKDGLRWTMVGLAIGLAATAAIGRWLQSNLYQTKPLDSGVLLASIAVLGITVVWGTLVPSLRASRTDPALALRRE